MSVVETTQAPLAPEAVPVLTGALERAAAKVFQRANRAGQEARTNLWGLSMSGIGGCSRQAAYRLAGVPPTDAALAMEAEARQAMLGTWAHEGFLPHLAEVLHGSQYELPLTLRVDEVTVRGTTDLHTRVMGGGVVDLKTIGSHKVGEISRGGVRADHRAQVQGYALAAQQAGLPVAWTAWYYLDRDTGEIVPVVEPFGPEQAEGVRERVRELRRYAEAADYAPRTERGPGLSVVCDGCPWLRQCWGPEAEPGDTGALAVRAAEEIAFAAAKYAELREQKAALEREMESFGAMVGTPPQGRYGPVTVTYGRTGEEPDKKEAMELLRLHGIGVPMRVRNGNRYIRWAKAEQS